MPNIASTNYMTDVIMPSNRKRGCKCPYTAEAYRKGGWHHQAGCPSSYVECLPNAARLIEALRAGRGGR